MTAAVPKFHPLSLSLEDDRIDRLYRLVKPQLPVGAAAAQRPLLALSSGLAGSALSVTFPSNREIIAEVSARESSTDILLTSAPDSIRSFFQRAENTLSAGTEITAQYGLSLLRRIRGLVVDIRPNNLQGVVHALVGDEDGSATIEWIRNRSRLGFVLDQENESSWFIVLPNGFSDSGYLYGGSGLRSLRGLLEKFITAGGSAAVTAPSGIEKPFPQRCLRGLREDKMAGRDQETSIIWIMGKAFEPPWGSSQDRKFKHKSDHYETSINWEDQVLESFQILCEDQNNTKHGILSIYLADLERAKQFSQLTLTSFGWERDEIRGKNPFHGNLLFEGTLSKHVVRMLAAIVANHVQENVILIESQSYEIELAARAAHPPTTSKSEHLNFWHRVVSRTRAMFKR